MHFLDERCTFSLNRFPFVTLAFFAACAAAHYAKVEQAAYSTTAEWYTPFSYAFFHTDSSHLWNNMVVFIVAGSINELIGGNGRMLTVVLVSIPIAASGHGLFYSNRVVGASGVVYATIVYQLTLVVKNWHEMRIRTDNGGLLVRSLVSDRRARVAVALVLLVSEIIVSRRSTNISHATHGFGSLAGFALSVAIGVNVRIDCWELVLPCIGTIIYVSLLVVCIGSGQAEAGAFAALPLPLVFFFAGKEVRKWTRETRTTRVRIGTS